MNARSIINKIDYLRAEVRVLDLDIIGITESWADEMIANEELLLEGYELFRCDRPLGIKGGGVLLYIRGCLNASLCELKNDHPEQVWCKLKYNGRDELLIGVCYRTPSENVYGSSAHRQIRELIDAISSKKFLLMGDFNYRGIDWTLNSLEGSASLESRLFLECVTKKYVCQHVNFPTTEKSVHDLILTSDPELVCDVQDPGAFYTSDHKLLCFNLDIVKDMERSSSVRYDYKRMDIKGAQEKLKSFNWEEELSGSVEEDWERLKQILFNIQNKYVPTCKQSRRNKKSWLSYKAMKVGQAGPTASQGCRAEITKRL